MRTNCFGRPTKRPGLPMLGLALALSAGVLTSALAQGDRPSEPRGPDRPPRFEREAPEPGSERENGARAEVRRPMVARQLELRRHADELEAKMLELREAGKPDQAAEVARELRQVRQEMTELRARAVEGPPMAGRPRPEERRGERVAMERRMEHARIAIENLRAGGMPDLAERLEREVDRRRQQWAEEAGPGAPRPERERLEQMERAERMQQAIRHLEDRVQDLARQVERLSQDRR